MIPYINQIALLPLLNHIHAQQVLLVTYDYIRQMVYWLWPNKRLASLPSPSFLDGNVYRPIPQPHIEVFFEAVDKVVVGPRSKHKIIFPFQSILALPYHAMFCF